MVRNYPLQFIQHFNLYWLITITFVVKIDQREVWIAVLSIFFSCCKIILSLSWLTCALGSLKLAASTYLGDLFYRVDSCETFKVILFLRDKLDALLIELFIASATSFTGMLIAARYYFLDSTPLEWYWLISSISFSSSSSSLWSSFLSSYFFFPL